MDRGYFAHNEANDMLLLRKLSTDVGLFSTVGECEKYACCDASGVTKDGKIAIVELKNRYNEIQDFGDIFIDSKKVAYLLLEYITKGYIPLYIINIYFFNKTLIFFNFFVKNRHFLK